MFLLELASKVASGAFMRYFYTVFNVDSSFRTFSIISTAQITTFLVGLKGLLSKEILNLGTFGGAGNSSLDPSVPLTVVRPTQTQIPTPPSGPPSPLVKPTLVRGGRAQHFQRGNFGDGSDWNVPTGFSQTPGGPAFGQAVTTEASKPKGWEGLISLLHKLPSEVEARNPKPVGATVTVNGQTWVVPSDGKPPITTRPSRTECAALIKAQNPKPVGATVTVNGQT
ncbi:hypothetical protein G7Y89_g13609 [Cudoniella acicularis]|uniref:Uncharacterized protein n=1 Tax=Cudoniella acicularis TaxID=354080 RepID=A0A8H4RAC6_9HELO|nr:hypothetical protein G7Y89_g13609 [Cudoniella acicularis]